MYIKSVFHEIPDLPKIEDVIAFMKNRSLYDPWKVRDIRFYTKRFPAKKIDWDSYFARSIITAIHYIPKARTLRGVVEQGSRLYCVDNKRNFMPVAYDLCDECDWITPYGHSQNCNLGMIERIHEE